MKKNFFFLGMLVCLLALGLMFVSCDNGSTNESSPNDGTYSKGTDRLVLSGTNYTYRTVISGTLMDASKGTFSADLSADSGAITINQTHELNNSGQLASSPQSESGTFTKSGNSVTFAGFYNFPVNGTWTK
jgi:hypothetical protein